ncbi:glycosyltransferase family 39 protein [Azospirillum sp. sgz301742]
MNYPLSLTQTAVQTDARGQLHYGPVWDQLARVLLLGMLVIVALSFQDYGITTDEEVQHIYGKELLSFYLSGFQDQSAFHFKDLYLYGGLFDLVVAVLLPVSPFDEYATRHLLCGLLGVVGVAGTWRLGRQLGGPRAGLLAAALLALSGVYYGAMFNNTKDVPFAAGMVWMLYFATRILQQMPRPSRSASLKFGLMLGLSLGIRVGAVFGVFYLGVALLLHAALVWHTEGRRQMLQDVTRAALTLLPVLPIAYVVMAVFWPWAVMNPLNPLEALSAFSHFPIKIATLLNGVSVQSNDPPAYYVPLYLLVKLPEVMVVGLVWALGIGAVATGRLVLQPGRRYTAIFWVPTVLAVFVPILVFVLMRPTIYNGIRHFLFVVPPMAVLAAFALDRAWAASEGWGRKAGHIFASALTVLGVVYVWQLASMHPNQYVYYNQFIGGLRGAVGKFELDYWGNSLHEATKELISFIERENNGEAPKQTYTVAVCGNPLAVRYDLPPWLKLVDKDPDWRRADFFMAFTQVRGCPNLLDGQPILEIAADGVPLSIVKDRRPPEKRVH